MDLPAFLSTTQSSNSEVKNENSMIVSAASKRARFLSTYQCQSFSLPDSIMFYVSKNPTTPELYEKMTQTCKYFYVKNPILVISGLRNYNNEWRDGEYGSANSKKYDMAKFLCKFWISKRFFVGRKHVLVHEEINPNLVSSITPKLYRCHVRDIYLANQIISYSDLPLLISSAERIILNFGSTVKYGNGSNVPFEKIVEFAVNAKQIHMYDPTITSETMKELAKIPHFAKLEYISVHLTSEVFDIETFYKYITMNNQKFWLRFVNPISDAYKSRLNKFVDKILATELFNYKPPLIQFDGIDAEKSRKIFHFYRTL